MTLQMYPKAEIDVDAIPELIAAEKGKLKLIRGQNPRFVWQDPKAAYHGPEPMMQKAYEIAVKLSKSPDRPMK